MGAADFFGGLLEGVGNTILIKQERDYQKRLQDTQDRRALLTSVLQDPNATWGQKATALQRLGTDLSAQPEQSMAGKLVGKVRGKKGQAQPQPNPFESLVESYRNLDKAAQPPAQIAPMPQMQGLGPSAQTIAPLPQIRRGPGTPAEAEAQRASAARMAEYQRKSETDIQMDRRLFEQRWETGYQKGLRGEALHNYAAGQSLTPGMGGRPLIGVNVPGTALPANAVDLDGKPIPPDARTAQRAFRPIQFGMDEQGQPQLRYTEVMPPRSGAATQFATWMNAAQGRKGSPLTPEETQREIEKYAKLHTPSPTQIYQDTQAREKAKIDIAQTYPQLTPAGQTALTNIEPTIGQIDDLLQKLEAPDENGVPYKENNRNLYFTANRAKYALGIAPEEAELAGQIANLELVKITGAMPYATRSRNFQYIRQIQLHLPNAWVDSPMNVYQKLRVAKQNMERIRQDILQNDVKGKVTKGLSDVPKPAGARSAVSVGQTVTLKNGKKVRVTAIHPDGSFDAE